MAKKINTEEILSFTPAVIKTENNIKAPTFERGYEPFVNNKIVFEEIKNNIQNLKLNEFLIISSKDTGLNFYELRKRISNIALCHKKKFIEKNFYINKISEVKLKIHRIK